MHVYPSVQYVLRTRGCHSRGPLYTGLCVPIGAMGTNGFVTGSSFHLFVEVDDESDADSDDNDDDDDDHDNDSGVAPSNLFLL